MLWFLDRLQKPNMGPRLQKPNVGPRLLKPNGAGLPSMHYCEVSVVNWTGRQTYRGHLEGQNHLMK